MSFTHSKNAAAKRRGTTSRSRAAGSRTSSAIGKRQVVEPDSLVTPSSGNIFEDVGFPPAEARVLLLRSYLMVCIEDVIKRRKLTQAKAAKLLHVTQPRISDLMRGKASKFSVDTLMEMLWHAGIKVDVSLNSKAA